MCKKTEDTSIPGHIIITLEFGSRNVQDADP
jgi:hypothetical protein